MTTVSAAGRGNCPPQAARAPGRSHLLLVAAGSTLHARPAWGSGTRSAGTTRGVGTSVEQARGAGCGLTRDTRGPPTPAPQALWRRRLEDQGLRCAGPAGAAAARTVGSPVQPRSRLSQHRPRRRDADARPFPGTSFRLPSCAQYAALPDTLKCGKRRGKNSQLNLTGTASTPEAPGDRRHARTDGGRGRAGCVLSADAPGRGMKSSPEHGSTETDPTETTDDSAGGGGSGGELSLSRGGDPCRVPCPSLAGRAPGTLGPATRSGPSAVHSPRAPA